MSARASLVGALVLAVLLTAAPALATGGGWTFGAISTLDWTERGWAPPYDYVDGRIYMPDGTTLVGDGALVQIIIGVNGADIVDPMDYFDDPANGGNGNGALDYLEQLAFRDWLRGGADPADISGGTNVLAYGTLGFTGEFATAGGAVNWADLPGSPPVIANGVAHDKLAWRAWSQPKWVLEVWDDYMSHPELVGTELWYTAGREFGTHDNAGGGPDSGWWIGMPDMGPGGDVTLWNGFDSPIGAEIYDYYVNGNPLARSQNKLDNYVGYFVPEPGSFLLVGSGLLLLAARGWRKRTRARVREMMAGRILCAAVVVLVVLLAAPLAYAVYEGGWQFNAITTLNWTAMGWGPPYDYVDGRIYENDGTTLVKDGSLVQVIIGRLGAEIVDPLEYFDDPLNGGNSNGAIDGVERENVAAWVRAGADPADISGGQNQLASMACLTTGEYATAGGEVSWVAPPGHECCTAYGTVHDKLAWRAWNLTKDELLTWCDLDNHPEMLGVELWYTDGREYFSHTNTGGGPDTGWWIGMPDLEAGDDPSLWSEFNHPIGGEIYAHYVLGETAARSENRLDHFLGVCIPEPGTVLLVGSALLLLVARGARRRSPAAAE